MTIYDLIERVHLIYPGRWVALHSLDPAHVEDSYTCTAFSLASLTSHFENTTEIKEVVLIVPPGDTRSMMAHHLRQ